MHGSPRRGVADGVCLPYNEDDGPRLYARLGFVTAGIIPGYARNADGGFDATAYMYKRLDTRN